jgi:hypothetical protein
MPGEVLRIGSAIELRGEALEEPASEEPKQVPVTHSLLKLWFEPRQQTGPRLICLTGLDAGRIYALGPESSTVGRALHVGIRIRDRAVSRLHALLELREDLRWLTPAGSENPVLLNGAPLSRPHVLESGDIISLGYTHLRYLDPRPEVGEQESIEDVAANPDSGIPGDQGESESTGDEAAASPSGFFGMSGLPDWRWMLAGTLLVVLGALMRFH